MSKVIIYLDGSVDVKGLKELQPHCQFLIFPYDNDTQQRKDVKWELETASETQLRDMHMPWKDIDFTLNAHKASEKLSEIYSIIGNAP